MRAVIGPGQFPESVHAAHCYARLCRLQVVQRCFTALSLRAQREGSTQYDERSSTLEHPDCSYVSICRRRWCPDKDQQINFRPAVQARLLISAHVIRPLAGSPRLQIPR